MFNPKIKVFKYIFDCAFLIFKFNLNNKDISETILKNLDC